MNTQVEFAAIMAPANQEWWWYWVRAGDELGQRLAQNKAMLTALSPYVDTDSKLKFAAIMAPANQEWWWYWGLTGDGLGQRLAQNKAMLTALSPYVDTDSKLKFAAIMAPANQEWWWYWGLTGDELGRQANGNKARLKALSPYLAASQQLIGKVVVEPQTVVPGQPVFVQVSGTSGTALSDPSIEVSIQGVPGASRYYQFGTEGTRTLTVRAVKSGVTETSQATIKVSGTPLAFRPSLTPPTFTEIPMLQVSVVPGKPYAATFHLGTTDGVRRALATELSQKAAHMVASADTQM